MSHRLHAHFQCSCQPTHEVATCFTLSRCKLPAAHSFALYAHIMLKSILQPHCPLFCMEKLNPIHIWSDQMVTYISLIFGLNSI